MYIEFILLIEIIPFRISVHFQHVKSMQIFVHDADFCYKLGHSFFKT